MDISIFKVAHPFLRTYLLRDINPLLARTDGTSAGTQLVQDLSPGTGEQQPTHETVIAFGQNLYFSANTGATYGVHGLYTTLTCKEMILLLHEKTAVPCLVHVCPD